MYADRRDADKRYAEIFEELKSNGRTPRLRVVIGGSTASTGRQAPQEPEALKMGEAAFRGIFGRIVDMVDPHTEEDRVAVLGSALTCFGNAIGRGPYVQVGATRHHANLYCALVGRSSKARKGSATDPVKNIMRSADDSWGTNKIVSGLSSGEGLINEIRDPIKVPDKDGEMKVVDPGVEDKRLLVAEGELSQGKHVYAAEVASSKRRASRERGA